MPLFPGGCRPSVQHACKARAPSCRPACDRPAPIRAQSLKLEGVRNGNSSESPMLNAFCRVAPSVRFNFLAILAAGVFLRAMVFSSRTSVEVHARRFFDFLGINPPYQIGSWYPLAGAEEIGTDRFSIMSSWSNMAADTAGKLRKGIVRSFLAIYRLGSNCNFQTVPPRFFDGSRPYYASSSGSASIASTKKTAVGARSRMDERRSRDFDLSSHVCLMARNRTACRRPTPRLLHRGGALP